MRIRPFLVACFLSLLLPVAGSAAERIITIRSGATTNPAAGVFASLEDLRKALTAEPPQIYLDEGTVIILHNSDYSLEDGFELPGGVDITIRGAGSGVTIGGKTPGAAAPFQVVGDNPMLSLENVHFTANKDVISTQAVAMMNTDYAVVGNLSISGSTFDSGNASSTILLVGDFEATITNSVIHGGTLNSIMHGAGDLDLNVVFNNNASARTIWTGDWWIGMDMGPTGVVSDATVNVSVAAGKYFELQGTIGYLVAENDDGLLQRYATNVSNITKTGGGVWKVSDDGLVGSITIDEGTLHFKEWTLWTVGRPISDTETVMGNITVGKNGIFKPSVTAGNLEEFMLGRADEWTGAGCTVFVTGSFYTENGARLEVGGISTFPQLYNSDEGRTGSYVQQVEVGYKMIIATGTLYEVAPSMTIDNRLMKASLKLADLTATTINGALNADPANYNGYLLHIEQVNDLATLDGVGSFADVYRKMDLSDVERDMLDGIYNRGGAGDDLGFLQTLGGYHVQNSMVAMRHHQANMLHKVNQRLTAYQKEDLDDLSINGGEICNYSDWDACTDRGEMWAYVDQSWMSQNDVDSIAGYRYQAHTLGLGYDWHTGSWIYGGILNYSAGKMKLRNNYGSYTDIDNLLGAVYASWGQDGYYLNGIGVAGYGWNDSTSAYTMPELRTVAKTGNYATSMAGLSLEGGYMWETEFRGQPIRVTPYGSLTYARLHRNAVRESGADFEGTTLNRQFRAADWDMWEFAVGARWAMPLERDGYTLIPNVDVAYTRTLGTPETDGGDAFFVDRNSSGWKIPVMASNRSSLRMSANLDARIKENLTIGAGYEFEWRHRYWKHQLGVAMTLGF